MQCGGRSAGGSTITVCRAPWRKWIARQEIKIDARRRRRRRRGNGNESKIKIHTETKNRKKNGNENLQILQYVIGRLNCFRHTRTQNTNSHSLPYKTFYFRIFSNLTISPVGYGPPYLEIPIPNGTFSTDNRKHKIHLFCESRLKF